jgi:N-acetylglucosaminyldiphosphoundecaprenol N-acetyl-beta-D-mannosaminyltransferase
MASRDFSMTTQGPAVMWALGVRVHIVQIPDVVAIMERWIQTEPQKCHFIVASGMHALMEGRRDHNFRAILNSADLFIPDGYSLIWFARQRGFKMERRATGTGLMQEFCRVSAQKGYSNFFYGDTYDVLQQLRTRLRERYPGLKVVGIHSPPFRELTPEEDRHEVELINETKPDVLWVALGLPKQERWMFEHRDRLNVPVIVGVGAAFRFSSGKVKRAPSWMGEHGLEWAWRFIQEPRKLWRRALIDTPRFIYYAALEACRKKSGEP